MRIEIICIIFLATKSHELGRNIYYIMNKVVFLKFKNFRRFYSDIWDIQLQSMQKNFFQQGNFLLVFTNVSTDIL